MSNLAKSIMLLSIGLVLAAVSIWLIGGKKKEYDTTVAINARASQIFPYLVQSDLKKEWMQGLMEQELVGGLPIKEGAELRIVQESNGDMNETNGLVIRYAENEIISIKSNSPSKLLTSIFKLKEINKKTEVEYRLIVRFNGLNRFISVFSEDKYRQEIESDLNNLVKLVESEYPNGWDANIDNAPSAGVDIGGSESADVPETTGEADPPNGDGSASKASSETDASNRATDGGGY